MTTLDPSMTPHVLSDRQRLWAFWLGCLVVTAGVILHVPMYLMGANIGYKLAGLIAQTLGILSAVPALKVAAPIIIVPLALAALLTARFGTETRGRDLRELEG